MEGSYQEILVFEKEKIKETVDKIISDNDYNYRNKITMKVRNNTIGFNKLNNSEIINIDKCLLADEIINEKLKYLKEINLNKINEIIIKSFNNKSMLVLNGCNDIKIDNIKTHFDAIYAGDKLVYGNRITTKINNVKYYIAPNSFLHRQ